MRIRLALMVIGWLLVAPLLLYAQTIGQVMTVRDATTGALVPNIGDDGLDAARVFIVGGASSGTEYTEDAAAAANPAGGALIIVRDDARAGSLTSADGDNVAARGTNAGELYVKHVDTIPVTQSGTWNVSNISGTVSLPTGASTLAEQQTQTTSLGVLDNVVLVDDAAFTPATSSVSMAGFEFDDTTPDSVNEGDAGAARMSANRNIYTTLRDAAGNERGANVNASNELLVAVSSIPSHAVTNAGTFAVQAAQSGTWTVQPGNTANTTAWLVTGTGGTFPATQSGTWNIGTVTTLTSITNAVQTKPIDGCGTTNYTANGAVASSGGDITTTTTCVDQISIANYHATNSTTVTVKDRAGTPIELLNSVTILPGQTVTIPLFGQTFTSGINAIAGAATTLRYWIKGRQ